MKIDGIIMTMQIQSGYTIKITNKIFSARNHIMRTEMLLRQVTTSLLLLPRSFSSLLGVLTQRVINFFGTSEPIELVALKMTTMFFEGVGNA